MAAGKDFKVQKGISSSGGSRCNQCELCVNGSLLKLLLIIAPRISRLCKFKTTLLYKVAYLCLEQSLFYVH